MAVDRSSRKLRPGWCVDSEGTYKNTLFAIPSEFLCINMAIRLGLYPFNADISI